MRLWQLVFAVMITGILMTLARDPLARVFIIIFITGLGEVVLGLASLMMLFQAVGEIGHAKGLMAHTEALMATSAVLATATFVMSVWLFIGFWLVAVFA